ncbi:cell division protein FtsK, partial [Amycolatopsis sp. NPDC003861]
MNSTPDPSTNTPADTPVNATGDDAVNTDPAATDTATTRAGNVVPIRPDTARTADEIPQQDRPAADDTEPGTVVRLVDPPATKATWWETVSDATARPLVAKWLTSAEEFKARARFLVRYAAHTFAFHALRVPVYIPSALLRAPGALCRLTARMGRWVFDAESKPVRMNARDRNDADVYMKLREARNETVRRRSAPVMVAVLVLLATAYLCLTFVPPVWNWTALAATLTAVGWWGAPADKPVAGRAVDSVKTPKLTSSMIEDALCSLGIGGLNQAYAKGKRIEFPNPIARDGDGWRADV